MFLLVLVIEQDVTMFMWTYLNVLAPRASQVPCDVINNGDGTFTIEYTANDVGKAMTFHSVR